MKVGFYIHIKEYFINLKSRSIMAMLLLLCFLWNNGIANHVTQIVKARTISLKLNAVSIPDGLSALEKKADCSINYNKSIFKDNSTISIDVKDMDLEQVLKKMLTGARVAYRFADPQTILLYKLPDPVKPGKISGKILDEKGETLPGASIKIIETGAGVQTSVDGSYVLSLNPGTYTMEISYLSYVTQRVTGVVVTEGKNTPLDVAMKPDAKGLKEVIVTANYRKASVEGLLARQKNAAELSNGISAEQIARTPDKNIGESLKRISGVSTIDNKFILVRGIGERYNSAMLDGVTLPSTEAQSRNFSFDLIPSNMVDNVVVSKTVTPDMNASFGGGLIQINTKDIPNENFTTFTAGTSYNDQTTGEDFLSHKRGKYDYFGFDDGRRDFPKDLQHTIRNTTPNEALSDVEYRKKVDDQSKKFTNDNFTMYHNQAAPSQNYQFTIGRLLSLDTSNSNKFGFTGSLSYRNTQSNNLITQQTRGGWHLESNNTGHVYGFNTTLGGLFNAGLQLGNNRFSFRNTYTHMYDNTLVRTIGYIMEEPPTAGVPPTRIQEADDPAFTDLLQNKLSGQHQLDKIKVEWNIARTSINREEKDLSIAESKPVKLGSDYEYFYIPGSASEPRINPTSRQHYHNKEQHYSWDVAATIPFDLSSIRSSLKVGYFGNRKKADFDWQIAAFSASPAIAESLLYIPISEMLKPEHLGVNGFQYTISPFFLDSYAGKSQSHAGYIMFDNRLMEKLRLVWGVRGEYYKYTEIENGQNDKTSVFSIKPDPRWQWLPSANLTYSPLSDLNIRAAYSSSVVRPEMMDNSQFWRYSPYLGAQYGNSGLYSTRINSWDFKTEWFPGLGEILSVGGFYKKFDRPAELTVITTNNTPSYYLQSSDWAKVYGLEFELRKNLNFIADNNLLNALSVYGNLTLQKSEVRGTYKTPNPDPTLPQIEVSSKQNRPMYGQTPYLVNAGIQYNGDRLGLNVMYNKSGLKTYITSELPENVEYEQPREQIDAQISYRFMKKRLEIKLNAGNLLNRVSLFYRNSGSYEANPDYIRGESNDASNATRLKAGFTNKLEAGDQVMFSQKFGRTYSTSLTWNF
ncbi:TonB-dependent receptor [Pedobacter metabolipauper]|uniref:Outer membrane receptor protein involved in Fe transport n=1 Tax=Pedobacter metabolipauper TaxID=425513 RepID=A0A4R6SSA1_9SPHI|nr:TonB-dependent receptor [Pedobacter metabolipauper]TDQ07483.1 outer membrane receptor protein involved in Fe transport [Pedobacter metabolipauper]